MAWNCGGAASRGGDASTGGAVATSWTGGYAEPSPNAQLLGSFVMLNFPHLEQGVYLPVDSTEVWSVVPWKDHRECTGDGGTCIARAAGWGGAKSYWCCSCESYRTRRFRASSMCWWCDLAGNPESLHTKFSKLCHCFNARHCFLKDAKARGESKAKRRIKEIIREHKAREQATIE